MAKVFLSDVFQQLVTSEYSQHFMRDEATNSLKPTEFEDVIIKLNLALLEIYTRHAIKTSQVDINLHPAMTRYVLDSEFASTVSTSTNPMLNYIQDSVHQPFEDDIILIDRIYNELGQELYVNDNNQLWSVYVPDYNVIYHPYPDQDNSLSIEYQASHKKIPLVATLVEAQSINVDIPVEILPAILHYIGSRSHIGLAADDPSNQNYAAKASFEESMLRLEKMYTHKIPQWTNIKLHEKGFI